jgi:hypothetical protein
MLRSTVPLVPVVEDPVPEVVLPLELALPLAVAPVPVFPVADVPLPLVPLLIPAWV